jgi:hypothetical protein
MRDDLISEGIVPVHITGTDVTVEKTPEHFVASGYLLSSGLASEPAGGDVTPVTQILQLDPMREEAVISFNGTGQVLLCHSLAQAESMATDITQLPDEADLITCPATIRIHGIGPLWAVPVPTALTYSGVELPYAVYTSGVATPATTFLSLGQIVTPAAGLYTVSGLTYLDGTIVVADDEDNFRLNMNVGAASPVIYNLLQPAVADAISYFGPFTVETDGTHNVAVQTGGKTPSGTANYHWFVTLTPLTAGTPVTSVSGVSVGVLQSRRGA